MTKAIIVVFSVILISQLCDFSPWEEAAVSTDRGRKQFELAQKNAASPVYGRCWLNALRQLDSGCRYLNDDTQSRLAIAFAGCFLVKSGRKPLECGMDESVASCLKHVESEAFAAYTAFFTHTQDMCYFLHSQAWREETSNVIDNLAKTSAGVVKELEEAGVKLRESGNLQREILEQQSSALYGLERLHNQGALLEDNLKVSGQVFEEFRQSVHSHEAVLLGIFQRLADLQGFVLRELSLFSTVAFYVVAIFVCYLLTSTSRTRDARFKMFLVLTANAVLEYWVSRIFSRAETSWEGNISIVSDSITTWVWMLRKTTTCSLIGIFVWSCYFHQDLKALSMSVMTEIRHDSLEIKRLLLQQIAASGKSPGYPGYPGSRDSLDSSSMYVSPISSRTAVDAYSVSSASTVLDADSIRSTEEIEISSQATSDVARSDTFRSASSFASRSSRGFSLPAAHLARKVSTPTVVDIHENVSRSTDWRKSRKDAARTFIAKTISDENREPSASRYNLRSRSKTPASNRGSLPPKSTSENRRKTSRSRSRARTSSSRLIDAGNLRK
ncbi:unnamed protein product [Notodromas monacha]|uniref:Brambleberry n=1 Tax=Notodromas monacha TaxID=399045 RepID=A0A7R9GCH0_9CRUS|nr:unnamed protein product [Notodromas monacha]CAG0917646.1 unnamed protein product [Notodromas monacha]